MTVNEFVSKYNFHDSLVESVNYDEKLKKLEMKVDFAFWMQDWYTDNLAETGIIKCCFYNVADVEVPSGINWEQVSIIEVSNQDEEIKFALINDFTDEYLSILIKCELVSVECDN